jgi:hypothetical protein
MKHTSHATRANERRGRSLGRPSYSELDDEHNRREERRKAEQGSVLLLHRTALNVPPPFTDIAQRAASGQASRRDHAHRPNHRTAD